MERDQVGVPMTVPSREDAHFTDTRTLQDVALTDSPSYGNFPWCLWWQGSCPAFILGSRQRKIEHK